MIGILCAMIFLTKLDKACLSSRALVGDFVSIELFIFGLVDLVRSCLTM